MAGTLVGSKGRAKSRGRARSVAKAPPSRSSNRSSEPSGNPGPAAPTTATEESLSPAAGPGPEGPTVARQADMDIARVTRQTMPAGPDVRRSGPTGGLRSFAEATEHETQVVTFQLAKEEYAIDILQVQEIVMMTKITRMPKAPHFIEGIVNLRGQMIPIIDMRKRFSLGEGVHDADTRIIIVDIGEIVGMVVDGVRDVIRLADSAISPPPPIIKGISAEYLKGIGQFNDRLLIMLELEKVLSAEEREVLRKLGPDGCPLSVDKRAEPKKRGRRDNKKI